MFNFSLIWEVNYNEWYRYIRERFKTWSINSFLLWIRSLLETSQNKKRATSHKVRKFPEIFCNVGHGNLFSLVFIFKLVGVICRFMSDGFNSLLKPFILHKCMVK